MDSFSEIWSAACVYMKEALNVSDVAFNLWISPLVPESFDGQTAKFTCTAMSVTSACMYENISL